MRSFDQEMKAAAEEYAFGDKRDINKMNERELYGRVGARSGFEHGANRALRSELVTSMERDLTYFKALHVGLRGLGEGDQVMLNKLFWRISVTLAAYHAARKGG